MFIIYKKGCPWSKAALKEIKKRKISYVKIVVSEHPKGGAEVSYRAFKKLIKSQTFPLVYSSKGKRIGGYEKLMEYFSKMK